MRTAILILALSLCGPVHAAQMAFAGLPDGGLLFKKVQSVRERKFADLVEQKTDFSCGAASLATILRHAYWLDVNEEQVIKGMLTTSDQKLVQTQGFSMLDMKRYAESIGMRARGYRIPADKLESVSIPVIVLMEIRGYKHFVVLQRAQKTGYTSATRSWDTSAIPMKISSRAGMASSSPSSAPAMTRPTRCSTHLPR